VDLQGSTLREQTHPEIRRKHGHLRADGESEKRHPHGPGHGHYSDSGGHWWGRVPEHAAVDGEQKRETRDAVRGSGVSLLEEAGAITTLPRVLSGSRKRCHPPRRVVSHGLSDCLLSDVPYRCIDVDTAAWSVQAGGSGTSLTDCTVLRVTSTVHLSSWSLATSAGQSQSLAAWISKRCMGLSRKWLAGRPFCAWD
jgi:hypothetical protein